MPMQKGILPVLGASVALVLAGCGGDDGGSTAAGDDNPLAEFFGDGVIEFSPGGGMGMSFGGSADFEISDDELQQIREVEELVAECMVDEGFEYTANVVNPEDYALPWQEAQELPPDEFAEQYGYGISTMHYSQYEDEMPEDPNQEYRESLSDDALAAYEQALYGDMMSWDPEEGPPPVEERGCRGQADAEVYGDRMADMEERADPWTEFEGLMEDVRSLSQRIHGDPRLEGAQQAWLDCMAEAGYSDFQRVGEAEQSVYQRMSEIEGWDMGGSDSADSGATAAPSDESGDSSGTVIQEPPEIDPEELAELQEYEVELAVADHKCMAEHYDDVFEEVSHELQEEFIAEHGGELKRYREWAEENDFDGGFGFGTGSSVSVD